MVTTNHERHSFSSITRSLLLQFIVRISEPLPLFATFCIQFSTRVEFSFFFFHFLFVFSPFFFQSSFLNGWRWVELKSLIFARVISSEGFFFLGVLRLWSSDVKLLCLFFFHPLFFFSIVLTTFWARELNKKYICLYCSDSIFIIFWEKIITKWKFSYKLLFHIRARITLLFTHDEETTTLCNSWDSCKYSTK